MKSLNRKLRKLSHQNRRKTWNVIIIVTCSCKSSGRKYLRRWLLCKILFSTIFFCVVTNFLLLNQFFDIRYIFIIYIIYIRYIFDTLLRSRVSMDNVFPHFVITKLKNKISQVVSICIHLVRIFHIVDSKFYQFLNIIKARSTFDSQETNDLS